MSIGKPLFLAKLDRFPRLRHPYFLFRLTNKDDQNNVEDPGSQHFPPENNNTPRIQHSSPLHNNQSTHLNSRRGSNYQQHEFNYEDLKHSEKSWQKTENNLKVTSFISK